MIKISYHKDLLCHDSLEKNLNKFNLWVLCIDFRNRKCLKRINKKYIKIISIKDYENDILKKTKKRENNCRILLDSYSIAPKIVFKQSEEIHTVTYLDADMFFFKNPKEVFNEFFNSKKSILITEHDFDEDHIYKEKTSGKYIVQFIIF